MSLFQDYPTSCRPHPLAHLFFCRIRLFLQRSFRAMAEARMGWRSCRCVCVASQLVPNSPLRKSTSLLFCTFFLIALFSSWRALIHHALLCRTPRDLDEFQVNPAQVFEFIYSGHHHAVSLSFHRWATILTASRLRRIMALLQTRQGRTRKMI